MCCLLRPITQIFSPDVPIHEPSHVYERSSVEKITRIVLGLLSAAAAAFSVSGFARSGNPLVLLAAFGFGCVSFVLFDLSNLSCFRSRIHPGAHHVVAMHVPPPAPYFSLGFGSLLGRVTNFFSSGRPYGGAALGHRLPQSRPVGVTSVSSAGHHMPHPMRLGTSIGIHPSAPSPQTHLLPLRAQVGQYSSLPPVSTLRAPAGIRLGSTPAIVGDPRSPTARAAVGEGPR